MTVGPQAEALRVAAALLERGAVVTDGIPELARGVLALRDHGEDLPQHVYLLKAAADRLTWRERMDEIVLDPTEDRLCALVDALNDWLQNPGGGT